MPSTSALLQGLLRLSPYEAKQRVEATRACGPRATLTGEPLPPLHPQLADAQAAGLVSAEHIKVILAALNALPDTLSIEECGLAEKHLIQAAATRCVRARSACSLSGYWLTCTPTTPFRRTPNSNAAAASPCCPTPTAAMPHRGGSPRSAALSYSHGCRPGQRHDPVTTPALTRARTANGCTTRSSNSPASRFGASSWSSQARPRIISMTADQLSTRQGLVETSFGQALTVEDALRMADEASLHLLLRDQHGAVLRHGRTKRIATGARPWR